MVSPEWMWISVGVPLCFVDSVNRLFPQPLDEFLKAFITDDCFNRIEAIPQFFIGPSLMDKAMTTGTDGDRDFALLGLRDDVMVLDYVVRVIPSAKFTLHSVSLLSIYFHLPV